MAQNEGVLDKVKRTFFRMASPFDVDAAKLDPLVSMNYAPMMARRDAAYDRATKLLRDNIFARAEPQRREIYAACLKLLDTAVDNTRIILAPVKKGLKAPDREPMLVYLKLLRETVAAASALVTHEIQLSVDEKEMNAFIGSQSIEQFHVASDLFSDSEMNIYHCVIELADGAEAAILRYREHRKRAFDKADLERYNKAFSEFEILYSRAGKLQ